MAWVVVGPRGAKRLVKKRIVAEDEIKAGRRLLQRRGTEADRGRPRPAEEEMDLEYLGGTQDPPATTRGRLGSKRGRGESADAEEPPPARSKH